jgi:hypothetical protein
MLINSPLKRLSFIIAFLLYSCTPDRPKQNPIKEAALKDPIQETIDTIKYLPLPEPPESDQKVKTDSSFITTKNYEDLNSIREFNDLDSIDRTYYKEYYFDTRKIKEQGILENGDCAGRWKYYNKKGTLIKEINFDTGEKRLYNNKVDPFDDVFLEMRSKGDSILALYFGEEFVRDHLQWNPNRSYYYTQNSSGSWFEVPGEEPKEFVFAYFILLDKDHKYPTIEFKLNNKGDMIRWSYHSTGLKLCGPTCEFNIDIASATAIARQHGLRITNQKYEISLNWNKQNILTGNFSGDYELIITEFADKKTVNAHKTIEYFNAVIIDPWSGKFLRKTRFQNTYNVSPTCSYSSGMIECN